MKLIFSISLLLFLCISVGCIGIDGLVEVIDSDDWEIINNSGVQIDDMFRTNVGFYKVDYYTYEYNEFIPHFEKITVSDVLKTVTLDNVRVGDMVRTSNGFSKVCFTHEDNNIQRVINIKTRYDKINIKLPKNHMIAIKKDNDEILAVSKDIKYIRADDLAIGDSIKIIYFVEKLRWIENDTHTFLSINKAAENILWTEIVEIVDDYANVKYVLTDTDDIVVNGIIVSCQVDNLGLGQIVNSVLGHYITYPLRWISLKLNIFY